MTEKTREGRQKGPCRETRGEEQEARQGEGEGREEEDGTTGRGGRKVSVAWWCHC